MLRTITWGPAKGQQMTPEQAAEYNRQYPASDAEYAEYQQTNGLSNVTLNAAQPGGAARATLGVAAEDPVHASNMADIENFELPAYMGVQGDQDWHKYFSNGMSASPLAMPGFNGGLANNDRIQQQRVIQELQAQASGNMNSQAQQQLGQGYQQARAQQSSLGSSIRGQSAGAAQRGIMQGQQGLQRGFAGDQQMLKLQEQQAAQQALQQMLAQQYGQDISQAGYAGKGALEGRELNELMKQFYTSGAVGMSIADSQYGSDYRRAEAGMDLDEREIRDGQINKLLGASATGLATTASVLGNLDDPDKKKKE